MRIFFSEQSKNFLSTLNYPLESASQLVGRIENNFIRIDAIIPIKTISQSDNGCSIAIPRTELSENVIGIFHTHPNGNILPSDSDANVMRELFPQREATILISEKRAGKWIIHPFIILKNSKMTMLDSINI